MREWRLIRKGAEYQELSEKLGVHPMLIRIMLNRGITTVEEMQEFLEPTAPYGKPEELKDMDKCCRLLLESIDAKKSIRIIGDYDVDGVCATAILYKALQLMGAKVDYNIPHRMHDGYGINVSMVQRAKEEGIDTIITCDNGISALEAITLGKELGLTILVTDHHEVPYQEEDGVRKYQLPPADAIVNPKQSDCSYPMKGICGAMVAFKCMQQLWAEWKKRQMDEGLLAKWEKLEPELLQFAAIATIEDVVPLKNENRRLVKEGLELLQETESIGLSALRTVCNLDEKKLDCYHIGFILGPCINAAGRLESAEIALELLLSEDWKTAIALASQISELNIKRKDLTDFGFKRAVEIIEEEQLTEDKVLIVYIPDCHESVAGIVAGRLREHYDRPAFVLTDVHEKENILKGSGRSTESYHMFEALMKVKEQLLKFGGHSQAAGLSLEKAKLLEVRRLLNEQCTLSLQELADPIRIDADAPLNYFTVDLIKELEKLEPTGKDNEKPIFAQRNLKLVSVRLMGKDGITGQYKVIDENGEGGTLTLFRRNGELRSYLADKYGETPVDQLYNGKLPSTDMYLSVTYYSNINEYNGYLNVQNIITGYR